MMKILYFSSVSYGWMKQRPQFIAELLSKRYETDYLTCTPLGKHKEQADEKAPLPVRDIYVLPFALKSGLIRFINKLWLKLQVNFKKYDLVIATHPVQLSYIPKNKKIIYECMDLMEGFYERSSKKSVITLEKKLIKHTAAIITSADSLKEKLIEKGADENKITIIKNAADKNWVYHDTKAASLMHPNMVYIGTVSKWFDLETVTKFCIARPEKTVYIVGKCDCETKDLPCNLIFTGKVSHDDVRSYIKDADILLLPFKQTELVNYVDPVKMYEYLSFNKPVVSAYWNELKQYETNPHVHFYDNFEKFCSLCEIVPKSNYDINHEFVEQNCWEERMHRYFKVIENEIH